jgi:hypothetical protein
VKAHLILLAAALSLACAPKPVETSAPPVALRALERLAGTEIVVFPVQYLSWTDSLGWQQQIPNRVEFLARLDDQIEAALTARGLGQTWTFGRAIGRASRVNSMVMRDANHLSAEWLRARSIDEAVRDPLASQVRALVGLKGQRYALLPVELVLQNGPGGMGVATLRVVMIDSRMALIKWRGEISSDPMKTVSPALTESVATHFADLVVAP